MTQETERIRVAYLAWVRTVMVPGLGLVVLIAAEQLAVRFQFWGAPGGQEPLRFIVWAVATAGVAMGRNLKRRGPRKAPDKLAETRSFSWKLVALAFAPTPLGFVLSFLTRSSLDFFVMLLVSLVAFAMLFPTYAMWLDWNSPDAPADESEPS